MKIKNLKLKIAKPRKLLFTVKKAICIILILSISLQSNAQFLDSVAFAQEASGSGSTKALENLSDEAVSASVSGVTTSLFEDNYELKDHRSAVFRSKTSLRKLIKRHFSTSENLKVIVDNSLPSEQYSIRVVDSQKVSMNLEIRERYEGDELIFDIISPETNLRPGKYTIEVDSEDGTVLTQDFTWGVLAINTNKSIYLPEETAELSFAVLDNVGNMVCDASLELRISHSASFDNTQDKSSGQADSGLVTDVLSTENGDIKVNPECNIKDFVEKADYEAEYIVGGAGQYNLNLKAVTLDGEYSISDSFNVYESVKFDVERKTATRIYPPLHYPVELEITANEDFYGIITETVPAHFDISESTASGVLSFDTVEDVEPVLEEENVLGISDGITMPFAGDYPVSLYFGEELVDPLLIEKYNEYGVIGHDGIDFALPSGTPVLSVASGIVVLAQENHDYGTTVVVQHEWGKTYYGHLSKLDVYEGMEVEASQRIGLSGSTGLSTGPHLHFGIKPNENDMQNGYYGKINPAVYLKIADPKVLGVLSSNFNTEKKIIKWSVNLKKGEKIRLGYSYKAPNISPQFYLIGPLTFIDSNNSFVFKEQRKWQIAVDAITFARVQSANSATVSGNATATFSSTPIEGNLLVVYSVHRSEGTTPTISGSGWTGPIYRCYAVSGGSCGTASDSYRRAIAIWYKVAGASEPTGITVSWSPSSSQRVLAQEFEAGEVVEWTFEESATNDTGTGSTSPMSSGTTASVAAGEQLLVAVAGWRNESGAPGSVSWTNGITDLVNLSGGTFEVSLNSGYDQQTSSGTKESSVSWSGSGYEAIGGILVFSAAAANIPPTAPVTNDVPFDNERTLDTTPSFEFEAIDPDGTAGITYQIQVDDTYDFSSLVINCESDTSCATGAGSFTNTENGGDSDPFTEDQVVRFTPTTTLSSGTTYYWRVRAEDNSGEGGSGTYGSYSSIQSLTINTGLSQSDWFQTTDKQFSTGTLTDTETTGSDSVQIGAGDFAIEQQVTGSFDSTTSKNITFSSATSSDNAVIIWANLRDGGGTSINWDGLTEQFNTTFPTGNRAVMALGYGGDTTYNITWTGDSFYQAWGAVEISGVDSTTILDTAITRADEGTVTGFDYASITTNTDGALHLIGFTAGNVGGSGVTEPSGYTEVMDTTSRWLAYKVIATAGATGVQSITKPNDATYSWEMALKPAGASSGTIMSPAVDFDWLTGASSWGEASFSTTETNGDVDVSLFYNSSTDCDTIIPNAALSGNETGFDVASSPIDISGLNTTTYNRICLRATLTDSGGTPFLNDWTVEWSGGDETPSLSQLMRHGRWFNSSGAIQPFTF